MRKFAVRNYAVRTYAFVGVLLLMAAFVIGGCGGPDFTKMSDQDITKALEQEKQVVGAHVYKEDDMMVAAIVLSPEATQEYAARLTNKYAKGLAKRNPDLRVNVQAVNGKENLANVLVEPLKK